MRVLIACLLLIFPLAGAAREPAPGGKPHHLLYVGNSFYYYNNSLHGHVNRLLAAALPADQRREFASFSVTISGGHLAWHDVGAYLDAGIGSSSFDDNNEVIESATPFRFDTVLMMDCSRCPFDAATRPAFNRYARKHSKAARARGVTPAFFMTWAYSDKPEMIDTLAAEYFKVGNENAARVVPAGLAFQRALAGRPALALHVADRRHPTLAGTYLAACTVLASLYGIDPRGNSYDAGLSADNSRYLQQVAWETAQAFPAPERRSRR